MVQANTSTVLTSTNAQIAAALEALSIAGYTLLYQKRPSNSKEVYSDLPRKWRVVVISILVSSNWSIIMSILGILTSNNSDGNEFLIRFAINTSSISLIILLVFVSELILNVTNPNTTKKESERQIELLNKQADADSDQHTRQQKSSEAISSLTRIDKFKDEYKKFVKLLFKRAGHWPNYKQDDSTAIRNTIHSLHSKGVIGSNIATLHLIPHF